MTDNGNIAQELDQSSGRWLAGFPPRRWHLLLAGGCIAAVYLAGVTGRWWPTPDSALYLGLGRSLAAGDGYRFNGSAHNIVTPGLPLVLAGLRILFGEGFWAPNLFVALCGLAALVLAYLVTARLTDRRTALAVALATAFSYTFFYRSHLILTDAPFAALFWAILYAYLRYRAGSAWWLVPVGLISAAGIVVRAPGILILGSLAIGALMDRTPSGRDAAQNRPIRKGIFAAGVILGTIAVVGAGFYLAACIAVESMPIYARSFLSQLSTGTGVHLRYIGLGLMQLPRTMSEMLTSQKGIVPALLVGLPALLLGCIGGVNLWRRGERFVLPLIALSVLALAFFGRDDAVRPRYLLPIQPLLVLASMEGLCWSVRQFCRWRSTPIRPVWFLKAVTIFTAAIIACNAPRLMRNAVYYSYLSHTPRYYQVVRNGKFAELFPAAEILRQGPPPEVPAAVDSNQISTLHFLSRRPTVGLPKTRCPETLKDVKQRAGHKAKVICEYAKNHPKMGFFVVDIRATIKELVAEQEEMDRKPMTDEAKSAAGREFIQRLKSHLLDRAGMTLRHEGRRYHVYQR